jgi:hypothetical protein
MVCFVSPKFKGFLWLHWYVHPHWEITFFNGIHIYCDIPVMPKESLLTSSCVGPIGLYSDKFLCRIYLVGYKSNQINFIPIMGPRGTNRNYTYKLTRGKSWWLIEHYIQTCYRYIKYIILNVHVNKCMPKRYL